MNPIDNKFTMLLSSRLERFQIKSHQPFRVNCRCPLCGDSQKSQTKTRGWILEKNHELTVYYCHNCNASHNLQSLLKMIDPILYNDYIAEKGIYNLSTKKKEEPKVHFKTPKFRKAGSPLLKIKKISQLMPDHKARLYVESRQIPTNKHYKLYYAPKFVAWVNSLIPNKLDMQEHSRLILPFINPKEEVFGFQGRALDKSDLRYITIMLDESQEKVYGTDLIDYNSKYYIVEGPIDSLFLDNSIAMSGASFNESVIRNKENAVVIFDNEPRNRQIVDKMRKCVDDGYNVCFWPDTPGKDINDMVLAGMKTADIKLVIDLNTYSGLEAEMRLLTWKKV
jgi:transcription elongation factor Elf1